MTAGADETVLSLAESIELAHPLVARIAADVGVRLLAIKGPALALQNLRDSRVSVDVDVLVDRAGFETLRNALTGAGWVDSGVYDTPSVVPLHSVTHRHPIWLGELDVHHWFPGLLADPAEVFEVLWADRVTVQLGHVDVFAPAPFAHAAIAALHHLRDGATEWGTSGVADLVERVRRTFAPEQITALSRFAAQTGSSATLAPFLEAVGAPVLPPERPNVVGLQDWRLRSDASTYEILPWLVELGRLPWRGRPKFVLFALWNGDRRFRSWDPDVDGSRWDLMAARWLRLKRAARALPTALAELRRARRADPGRES